MSDSPHYKKMDISDDVTVTLPAHVWIGFVSAYTSTKWSNVDTSRIALTAQEQMLEPSFVKARDAERQAHIDRHERMAEKMASELGFGLDLSPNDPRNED